MAVSAALSWSLRLIFELVPGPGPAQLRWHDHASQLAGNFAKEKSENRFLKKLQIARGCPSRVAPRFGGMSESFSEFRVNFLRKFADFCSTIPENAVRNGK